MAARTQDVGRLGRPGGGRGARQLPLVDMRRQVVANVGRSMAGVAWRWRLELAGVLLALVGYGWLVAHLGQSGAWIVLGALAVLVALAPPVRRFVLGRSWCIVVRHRVFAVFDEARVFNRSGRCPTILHVRRTPVGERAVIWCRPGMNAQDIEARTGDFAAACFARSARVAKNPRWSHLVSVEIVRRDPLTAGNRVPSRLATYLHRKVERPARVPAPRTPNSSGPVPFPPTTGPAASGSADGPAAGWSWGVSDGE